MVWRDWLVCGYLEVVLQGDWWVINLSDNMQICSL